MTVCCKGLKKRSNKAKRSGKDQDCLISDSDFRAEDKEVIASRAVWILSLGVGKSAPQKRSSVLLEISLDSDWLTISSIAR